VRRLAGAAVLLVAAAALADATVPAPPGHDAKHVLLTAKQARTCPTLRAPFATVAASDVRTLDAGLARALADVRAHDQNGYLRDGAAKVAARLDQDVRYYVGRPDGHRRLRILRRHRRKRRCALPSHRGRRRLVQLADPLRRAARHVFGLRDQRRGLAALTKCRWRRSRARRAGAPAIACAAQPGATCRDRAWPGG
jgi:hypothetical protein